ncbi:hypothetical protein [Halostagnicola kamekurae]|uniref:ABC-2 type transport system permease protein n=1 Tax=Halostagnicola kamekurae TaxID=619731 RepID=A0A1I6QPY9_9EURY|nr:hypothetical protein [Halostagnicola kamekurae]SFS54567.1 hypothetical protein SAMN04488556_1442 [Halostagnicola kamekurae]
MSEESSDLSEPSSSTTVRTGSHGSRQHSSFTGVFPSSSRSREIARIELLRGYRWVRHQDFWLVFTALMGIMSAFFLLQTFDAARSVGLALAAGEGLPAWLVTATSVLWVFLTILLVGDGFGSNGNLDNDGQYLTIRPAADVAGGLLLAAAAKFSVYTIGLGLAAGAGLVAGTGSILPLLGITAAAIGIPATAAAIGYPIGFALKGFVRRSENLGQLTTVLGVVLGIAYVTLSVTGELLTVVERLEPVLQSPPVAWFGHLAFVTTPNAGVDLTGPLFLLGLMPVLVIGGTVLAVPAARYAWLADTARTSTGEGTKLPSAPDSRVDAVLAVVCRAPATRGIASTTLHRAVRSPFQFVFVAPPLVAAIVFIEGAVTTGSVPWYVPWFVVWYGAWVAGAVLPLNPLGNQGSTLPTLLTAPTRGRHVVHGNVTAAALAGVPLTAVVALAAGYLAGSSPPVLGALGVASVVAVTGSAIVATGIGSAFPRFDTVSFDGSRQAVPPSKRAYSLFSVTLSLIVIAVAFVADETARAVGVVLLTRWLPFGLDIGVETLAILSRAVLVGGIVGIAAAYRVAIHRIETYEI